MLNVNQTPPSNLSPALQVIWWLVQCIKDIFNTLNRIQIAGIPFMGIVISFILLSLILSTLYLRKG